MNRSKQLVLASGLIAVLASGAGALTTFASATDATMPNGMKMSGDMQTPQTAADYRAAADKYDQEAAELDTVAKQHSDMAALYRSRAIPGSKQYQSYFTLANHCDNLADLHRKSAAEARVTAQLHRDMANNGV
jgi:hypothetical protein